MWRDEVCFASLKTLTTFTWSPSMLQISAAVYKKLHERDSHLTGSRPPDTRAGHLTLRLAVRHFGARVMRGVTADTKGCGFHWKVVCLSQQAVHKKILLKVKSHYQPNPLLIKQSINKRRKQDISEQVYKHTCMHGCVFSMN